MNLNLTFDCPCGSDIDHNFYVDQSGEPEDAIIGDSEHYEQIKCSGCGQDFEAHVTGTHNKLNIYVDGAINLTFAELDLEPPDWDKFVASRLLPENDGNYAELSWVIRSTSQLTTFEKIMRDVVALLNADINIPNMSTLYNMAYAQVVTGVEAYLSGVFISRVVNSQQLIRKLVENDPELAKKPLSLKDIFVQYDGLQLLVAKYLQELIFHRLDKVKPMYKSVLDVDLGDIPWLFKAVQLRHDCVHRNGVNQDGKLTGIGKQDVVDLITQCATLIARVDNEIAKKLGDLDVDPLSQHVH
jgi:hypothetical protein